MYHNFVSLRTYVILNHTDMPARTYTHIPQCLNESPIRIYVKLRRIWHYPHIQRTRAICVYLICIAYIHILCERVCLRSLRIQFRPIDFQGYLSRAYIRIVCIFLSISWNHYICIWIAVCQKKRQKQIFHTFGWYLWCVRPSIYIYNRKNTHSMWKMVFLLILIWFY